MKFNSILLALLAGIVVTGCIGVSSTTIDTFGNYNMSVIDFEVVNDSGCSTYEWDVFSPTTNYINCSKESSIVQLYFGLQGSPSFYVNIPESNVDAGLGVISTPYTTDFSGLTPNCATESSQISGSYSCLTTLIAVEHESASVFFTIMGDAGNLQIFQVNYQ